MLLLVHLFFFFIPLFTGERLRIVRGRKLHGARGRRQRSPQAASPRVHEQKVDSKETAVEDQTRRNPGRAVTGQIGLAEVPKQRK